MGNVGLNQKILLLVAPWASLSDRARSRGLGSHFFINKLPIWLSHPMTDDRRDDYRRRPHQLT
jgi:hypothetical protein